jgi:hypothetical protein
MPDSFSPNLKLATPPLDAPDWTQELDRNRAILDRQNCLGNLAVTAHEYPSASLLFDVAPGSFIGPNGAAVTYAGSTSNPVIASAVTSVYLDSTGALATATSGFPLPPTAFVPLAVVTAGASAISSINDARVAYMLMGGTGLAAATAGTTWTTTEQGMLQAVYNAVKAMGVV